MLEGMPLNGVPVVPHGVDSASRRIKLLAGRLILDAEAKGF
jgi:hypothetical protein